MNKNIKDMSLEEKFDEIIRLLNKIEKEII